MMSRSRSQGTEVTTVTGAFSGMSVFVMVCETRHFMSFIVICARNVMIISL